MANETLPTIAADPERAGRPRPGRSRSRGGSSSLLFVNAVLVVLVAALLGAGWFIFEQHKRLVQAETLLADASNRIESLEDRLRMTDQLMSDSDTDLLAKLDEHFGQIDLLWGNYRKHRDGIRALEAKDKTFQTAVSRAEGSIKSVQGKVSALETAVAKQRDVATRVTELDIQLQDSIKQMRNVVDRANSAYQMASRLEASLGADVTKLKSDITAIDAHRAQVNADIADLKRQVNDLRLRSP
ncbi:MAG: hypothetical protein OXQ90_01560 [Gammaproteobacteria bacterium]|nr:hypothetical protein [Gammaproteobacteria bacterium]